MRYARETMRALRATLIHAGNLADALIATAICDECIGLALNACDNIDVSWKQYFRDISVCAGLKLPTSIPYATLEAMARKDEDPANLAEIDCL